MLYNAIERDGYLKKKPWWVGSWMLFPLAQGQLFHAFVFDRDCAPKVRSTDEAYTNEAEDYVPGLRRFHIEEYATVHPKAAIKYSTIAKMAKWRPNH